MSIHTFFTPEKRASGDSLLEGIERRKQFPELANEHIDDVLARLSFSDRTYWISSLWLSHELRMFEGTGCTTITPDKRATQNSVLGLKNLVGRFVGGTGAVDTAIVPLVGNGHWSVLILDMTGGKLTCWSYDSCQSYHARLRNVFLRFLHAYDLIDNVDDIRILYANISPQVGSWQCGYVAVSVICMYSLDQKHAPQPSDVAVDSTGDRAAWYIVKFMMALGKRDIFLSCIKARCENYFHFGQQ